MFETILAVALLLAGLRQLCQRHPAQRAGCEQSWRLHRRDAARVPRSGRSPWRRLPRPPWRMAAIPAYSWQFLLSH